MQIQNKLVKQCKQGSNQIQTSQAYPELGTAKPQLIYKYFIRGAFQTSGVVDREYSGPGMRAHVFEYITITNTSGNFNK